MILEIKKTLKHQLFKFFIKRVSKREAPILGNQMMPMLFHVENFNNFKFS